MSSAYIMHDNPSAAMTSSSGAQKRENNMGPRTDPCGAPWVTGNSDDSVSLMMMDCVRPERYDLNQDSTVLVKPYHL